MCTKAVIIAARLKELQQVHESYSINKAGIVVEGGGGGGGCGGDGGSSSTSSSSTSSSTSLFKIFNKKFLKLSKK